MTLFRPENWFVKWQSPNFLVNTFFRQKIGKVADFLTKMSFSDFFIVKFSEILQI